MSHGCGSNLSAVYLRIMFCYFERETLRCSTQSTPRVVQTMQQSAHTSSQQHSSGHVTTHSSSSSSHRAQRKNVINCVTVNDSDGEASPSRSHSHLYQQLPQHPQHQQTTQLIKHEPQQQHHVRWAFYNIFFCFVKNAFIGLQMPLHFQLIDFLLHVTCVYQMCGFFLCNFFHYYLCKQQ